MYNFTCVKQKNQLVPSNTLKNAAGLSHMQKCFVSLIPPVFKHANQHPFSLKSRPPHTGVFSIKVQRVYQNLQDSFLGGIEQLWLFHSNGIFFCPYFGFSIISPICLYGIQNSIIFGDIIFYIIYKVKVCEISKTIFII